MYSQNHSTPTYYEVLQRASSFLEKNNYSEFAAEWLLRERLGWSKTDLVVNYHKPIPAEEEKQFEEDLEKFVEGRPMQQIIGHDWFYGRRFKVTQDTLIPRPETEEWLDRVLKRLPSSESLEVLDIGTGSGVIAITVQLERPNDKITATDISEKALKVAEENNKLLEANVTFKQGSLFEPVKNKKFDVILCNPPYISEDEKSLMDDTVLHYEPKEALFAANNGLAVYEKIAASLSKHLNPNGLAFFEIGFAQGEAVSTIFKEILPEAKIEVWQDINQLDRVVAIYL